MRPDEVLSIEVTVERGKRIEVFGGIFRVDEYGRLVSQAYDDQQADICPEDVDEETKSLKKEILDFLKSTRRKFEMLLFWPRTWCRKS